MWQDIERYLNHLASGTSSSSNTVAAYRNDLTQLHHFLTDPDGPAARYAMLTPQNGHSTAGQSWADVSRTRIVGFIVALRDKGYAPTTIARKVAALKSFFHWLKSTGVLRADPTENLDSPKVDKALPRGLSPEQVGELIEQPGHGARPENVRDRAMIQILCATGLRVSELVALNVDDVDLGAGYLRCIGKGARERIIPVKVGAGRALEEYLQIARPGLTRRRDQPALFVNHRGNRLTRQGFWLILKEYAKAAGLPEDTTPQTLRHTFAIHELSNNADIRDLQELLGHANIATTQIYTQVARPQQPSPTIGEAERGALTLTFSQREREPSELPT
ncbi:MAG: tyrosine recombinase [Chloroflexi bacterium]|nr:tyrosine recombinase [Chloroflexota bacterium]